MARTATAASITGKGRVFKKQFAENNFFRADKIFLVGRIGINVIGAAVEKSGGKLAYQPVIKDHFYAKLLL